MKEIIESIWLAPADVVLSALAKALAGMAVAVVMLLFIGFVAYGIAKWARRG